ncbi:MAG: gas vesicle protein GvpJ [Salinibacter sp.]|uniref:gas vesicle protein GvpJ n=1 Tax=Salinibacter sp. TaxID=2065818 RepID=UPI0035D50D47
MAKQMQNMRGPRSTTLADLLERVLETGIVVAGDIKVNLNDVELLTVQIRLVICSVDKADQMGMDWWKSARYLQSEDSSSTQDDEDGQEQEKTQAQFDELNDRLDRLEATMNQLAEAKAEENGASEDDGA